MNYEESYLDITSRTSLCATHEHGSLSGNKEDVRCVRGAVFFLQGESVLHAERGYFLRPFSKVIQWSPSARGDVRVFRLPLFLNGALRPAFGFYSILCQRTCTVFEGTGTGERGRACR